MADAHKKNIVFLTGFMGSGKSTLAPLLANSIGYAFIDLDAEIEKRLGKTINRIFQEDGEQHFRSAEHAILTELQPRDHCVVSLGGGTIAHHNNIQLIKSLGILIYLKARPEKLLKRLRYKTDRPLLRTDKDKSPDDLELKERIDHLLTSREPFYRQADIVVFTDDKPVAYTVDDLVKRIRHLVD